ncbi:hypothetical protein Gotur_032360, partial [Gossypium turneri]
MSSQLISSSPTITEIPTPKLHSRSHTLSQRTQIPLHVYKHPAAILLELSTSIKEVYQILPHIIKCNLYTEHLFQTKLLSLFCNHGCIAEAARVFEPIQDKPEVLYYTLLKGYAKYSSLHEALLFFVRMKADNVKPVVYNFTYLLKVCGDKGELRRGKEIHGQLIKNGFSSNVFAMTGVNGLAKLALGLVVKMQEEGQRPDSVTLVSILPSVADMGLVKIGRSIHGYVLRAGFEGLVNVNTALVDMYSKCRYIGIGRLIFDGMKRRTMVSWNSMIDGYVRSGYAEEAMAIFEKMLDEGVEPTDVTIMGAARACADLGDLDRGMFVHKLSDKLKLGTNVSVMNSLISMYSKCKRVDLAVDIFKKLRGKTLVSWNAMILGFAQNGRVNDALNYFYEMHSRNMRPDTFTMVSVIPALAELSVTRQAKWIHGFCIRSCLDDDIFVMTALVDMYAKCGAIHTARKLFDRMNERHVTTWNAMIDGYGTHGLGKAALE